MQVFFKLSDTAIYDLCQLLNYVLPQPKMLNSGYNLISNAKKHLEDLTSKSDLDKSCNNFYILKLDFLLKEIVSRKTKWNLKCKSRNVNVYCDFPVSKLSENETEKFWS